MLTVWGRKTSVNVQKVMWLIGELDLTYERHDVGGAFGGLDTPEYDAMNPHRKIPTLQDGNLTTWESEAVLRYLGSTYGEQFFPAAIAERTAADQWMSWVQSTWSPAMTGVFISLIRVPTAARDQRLFSAQVDTLNTTAAFADNLLATRPYLAGAKLSLADIAFASFLYRYYSLEFDRGKPELPSLKQYYKNLCKRPAFVEHTHIDYDGLRVPGAERV